MKVSIITIAYNSAETIADTAKSVVDQTYPNIEYIIIDGASKDGTLDQLTPFKHRIARIVSEKDNGIYDAMNKGIRLASGEIIGVLNSDDLYADRRVIEDIVHLFEKSGSDAAYADLEYVRRDDHSQVTRRWKAGPYTEGQFLKGWMPPHPTFFVKRRVYEQWGLFNTDLKSAADYEIMLRFIHKHHISVAYLPRIITKMRVGGVSNASLRNRIRANIEDRLAWKINGLQPGWFTLTRKPLSKILQFFR
jgi:glycosyltransferase involved in cell wall biosynthesis